MSRSCWATSNHLGVCGNYFHGLARYLASPHRSARVRPAEEGSKTPPASCLSPDDPDFDLAEQAETLHGTFTQRFDFYRSSLPTPLAPGRPRGPAVTSVSP